MFSLVLSLAMISTFGFTAAYDSLPCQWSQWKCVLMTLTTGFLVSPWICWYMAREADGFECESTTTTPSSVMITAALQLTLYRVAAMAPYTPSPTFLSSKRSLSAVCAYADGAQHSS